jgi:hypothetical protein
MPPQSLGDLPLVVVRRGKKADAYDGLEGEQRALFDRNEPVWYAMQAELAGLSSRSTLLIAERSGHGVQQEQPEIVVEAIAIALELTEEERD